MEPLDATCVQACIRRISWNMINIDTFFYRHCLSDFVEFSQFANLLDSLWPFEHNVPLSSTRGTDVNIHRGMPGGNILEPKRQKRLPFCRRVFQMQRLCCDTSITEALTHRGRDKIGAFSQATFSNAFSWMKMYEFLLIFHWSLSL